MKKTYSSLLPIVLGFLIFPIQHSWAVDRCPKIETPASFFGLIFSTVLLPLGTTIAAARSSDTSGCGRGKPSSDFYRPRGTRIYHYLEETLELVAEESAQGRGQHVQALAYLAGCPQQNTSYFAQTLQKQYTYLFPENLSVREDQVHHATQQLILALQQPNLQPYCDLDPLPVGTEPSLRQYTLNLPPS